jgi:hypothetical protein
MARVKIIRVKKIVGASEKVSFPDLGLYDIDAKIDTGAYTTALHCHDIEEAEIGGRLALQYKILDPSHPEYNHKGFSTMSYTKKVVRNSFGDKEERFVIKTRIKIGTRTIRAFVSLTDRQSMRYPVLVGRKLLKGRFIVDAEFRNLLSN